MKLLPFERFAISTSMSQKEVIMELQKDTTVGPWIAFYGAQVTFFNGKVGYSDFRLKKSTIYTRNIFIPLIIGEIYEDDDGCQVDVKSRLSIGIYIFLTLWFSVCFVATIMLSREYLGTGDVGLSLLMTVFLIIWMY